MDRIAIGIVLIGILASVTMVGAGFWAAERTTVRLAVWASSTFGPPTADD